MTKETIQYKNIIAGISVFMLFLAIPKLPYGYYILLRWVVTISALFSGWVAYDSEDKFWVFLMGGIAILFNPIIPVHLTKDIWVIIDLIVAILFLVSIFTIKPKRQLPKEKKVQNLEEEQKKRDNVFLKCWKKGINDEELAEKFNLEIEGVKTLRERLKGKDKMAGRGKLGSKIITFSSLIIAIAAIVIAIKTFVGAPPTERSSSSFLEEKVNYMMNNPTDFLYIWFDYGPDERLEKELLGDVDTQGKLIIHVRDSRGVFSGKSGKDLLDQFNKELDSIGGSSFRVWMEFGGEKENIVAKFLSEEGDPSGYFYQGEYHLWGE